jgi:hypothetical protein
MNSPVLSFFSETIFLKNIWYSLKEEEGRAKAPHAIILW